jgi:DnaJ-class molecular chaperone
MATRRKTGKKKMAALLKSVQMEAPPKNHVEELQLQFRIYQRNSGVTCTKEEWMAAVTKLAHEYSKGETPTAQQWVDAARDATVTCDKCGGTGTYQWGACVNGRMTHSGTCFRCQGKGRQGQDDFKRNYGHNMHLRVI